LLSREEKEQAREYEKSQSAWVPVKSSKKNMISEETKYKLREKIKCKEEKCKPTEFLNS